MWRLLAAFAGVAALVGLMAFHGSAIAQPDGRPAADKQLICHVSDDNGAHIIEVAEPAVPAHLRNHGDCIINSDDRTLIGEPCDPTDSNDNDICDIQP